MATSPRFLDIRAGDTVEVIAGKDRGKRAWSSAHCRPPARSWSVA